MVKKICARSFLTREPITLAIAKECVAAYTKGVESQTITPDMIIAQVAKKYGVSKQDLYGRQRTKQIASARNISIYIIRRVTGISFPAIGELFERDHSTIISANDTVKTNMKSTPLFAMEIEDLIKEITE